jgi:hypothetical protein
MVITKGASFARPVAAIDDWELQDALQKDRGSFEETGGYCLLVLWKKSPKPSWREEGLLPLLLHQWNLKNARSWIMKMISITWNTLLVFFSINKEPNWVNSMLPRTLYNSRLREWGSKTRDQKNLHRTLQLTGFNSRLCEVLWAFYSAELAFEGHLFDTWPEVLTAGEKSAIACETLGYVVGSDFPAAPGTHSTIV